MLPQVLGVQSMSQMQPIRGRQAASRFCQQASRCFPGVVIVKFVELDHAGQSLIVHRVGRADVDGRCLLSSTDLDRMSMAPSSPVGINYVVSSEVLCFLGGQWRTTRIDCKQCHQPDYEP